MRETIAVIGAGNGGTAIAAHMAARGGRVRLCDPFPQYLEGIRESGAIALTCGEKTERAVLDLVTEDVAAAVRGAGLIMVVTPAFTHKLIARACAGVLEDGQIVVLNPGRTAGALDFLETVRTCGCTKDVTVAEAQTLIYSCRRTGPGAVQVYGVKSSVDLSAFPAGRTGAVLDALRPYYPQFTAVKNALCTSLANIGSMFHPVPVLLNIGRIEGDSRDFRYYWDGITPSVAALIEALDRERLAVGAAYGVSLLSAREWLTCSYDTRGNTLYEAIQSNGAYGDILAPKTIQARYITEDVPNGLVPIAALGRAAEAETPCIDAVITLACAIYGRDFRAEGRSLRNLGLEGLDQDGILRYFETGVK